jgi:hypothetical protein
MNSNRGRSRAQERDLGDQESAEGAEGNTPNGRVVRQRKPAVSRGAPTRSEKATSAGDGDEASSERDDGSGSVRRSGRASIGTVVSNARAQLQELTGRPSEGVTSMERDEEGWRLSVEVVELERIPASTSILGAYDVRVDGDGNLVEYTRIARYHRNQAGESE